jgi:diguanylate cyclase (GGDEF)-like protein
MKHDLSLVLLDIDDLGQWNARLGNDACDDLLRQVAGRVARLLRSYDQIGRLVKDEFLLLLPGCSANNAAIFAERMRVDVFCSPFRVAGESIRLSACFGIASSTGRSPVVVLREAEQAMQWARTAGPESIQSFGDNAYPFDAPGHFLSPSSGEELLAGQGQASDTLHTCRAPHVFSAAADETREATHPGRAETGLPRPAKTFTIFL